MITRIVLGLLVAYSRWMATSFFWMVMLSFLLIPFAILSLPRPSLVFSHCVVKAAPIRSQASSEVCSMGLIDWLIDWWFTKVTVDVDLIVFC